jgi:hypothetical protein
MLVPQGQLPNSPSCPRCGSLADGYTSIGDTVSPDEGAFTVCFYCGTMSVFEQRQFGLDLRELDEEEIRVFMLVCPPRTRVAILVLQERVRRQQLSPEHDEEES